jgi:uncharacterized membrane protein YsdA (DUF1294 family)
MTPAGTLPAAALYLVAVNAVTILAFAWDKHLARSGHWRVSERTLLTLAGAGGTVGALVAGQVLRHKTYKEPFRTRLRLIALVQVIVLGLVALGFPEVRDWVAQIIRTGG